MIPHVAFTRLAPPKLISIGCRYGDDVLTSKVRAREGDTTRLVKGSAFLLLMPAFTQVLFHPTNAHVHAFSFDDCVEQGGPDCDPKKMWLQVGIAIFTTALVSIVVKAVENITLTFSFQAVHFSDSFLLRLLPSMLGARF